MSERAKRAADELKARGWSIDHDGLTVECTRCGSDIGGGMNYCPQCGEKCPSHHDAGPLDDLEAAIVAACGEEPLRQLRGLVKDDAWAMTFQTLGQYRTALLKAIDEELKGRA